MMFAKHATAPLRGVLLVLPLFLGACTTPGEPFLEDSATAGTTTGTGTTVGEHGSETMTPPPIPMTSGGPASSTSTDAPTTEDTTGSTDDATTNTSTSEGDTSDSGTTDPGPMCGDGELDPGEECDLGEENDNLGDCRKDCLLPFCGDGFTQPDELCDEGPNNHPNAYGGCTPECTPGPFCGDGATDPVHEECDASDPKPMDELVCTECKLDARRVFVTKESFDGVLGGLDGADGACQASAAQAGLTNNGEVFRAWLSDDESSASSRLTHSEVPYVLAQDSTVVAAKWADLVNGSLAHPIDVDQFGDPVKTVLYVWTNTTPSGSANDAACANWSSKSLFEKGHRGRLNESSDEWTASEAKSPINCSEESRLYCIEQ